MTTSPTRLTRPGRRGVTAASWVGGGGGNPPVPIHYQPQQPQQQQYHRKPLPPPSPPQRHLHSSPPRRRRQSCHSFTRKRWASTIVPYAALLWILGRLTWTVRHFETSLLLDTTREQQHYFTLPFDTSTSSNARMTFHSNSKNHNDNNDNKKYTNASLPFSYRTLLQEYHIPFVSSPYLSLSSSSVSSSLAAEEPFDPWMLVQRSASSTDHYERRLRQSRPPPFHHNRTFSPLLFWNDHHNNNNNNVTTISLTNEDDDDDENDNFSNSTITHQNINHPTDHPSQNYDWNDWCQRAHLSKHSRVVITNALSVAIGPPLTLFLYHVCHVPSIMIVDAMLPNLKQGRLIVLDTHYRTLVRSIPGLKWTVPTATAGLAKRTTTHGNNNHNHTTDDDDSSLTWLDTYRPTLVLHLEDESRKNEWLEHITTTGYELYRIHNSILSMQQLLHYHQTRSTTRELSMLHILTGGTTLLPLSLPDHPHPATTWTRRINDMLAQYVVTVAQYQQHPPSMTSDRNQTLRVNQLQIPFTIFGPLVPHHNHNNNTTNDPLLYMDDAIVGVLKALQQQQQLPAVSSGAHFRLTGSVSLLAARMQQQLFQDQVYRHHDRYPYGFRTGITTNRLSTGITTTNETQVLSRRTYQNIVAPIDRFYGIHKTRFPCASTCFNEEWYDANDGEEDRICDASVLDTIYPISRSITKHCSFVVYYVNLDVHWNKTLALPKEFVGKRPPKSDKLCRIAFVSRQSVMLRNLIVELHAKEEDAEKELRDNNGKLVANGWSLIWVDGGTEEPHSTTNIEVDTLLRIEPSRFFASKVKKAMYTDSEIIASTSDVAIRQILSNIDRPAHPHGHLTNDYRSGYDNIHRSIYHPPSRGRSVAFFASEMEQDRPKNLGEYLQRHLSDMADSDIKKSRPINYYKQMSHWVQSDTNRPLGDGIGVILHVPWIWISMKFFVHDLQSHAARWFRCSWYDTYLYWGNDRIPGTEDLSLAYVFAKHRLLGTIGPGMEDGSWLPLQQHTLEPSDVGDDDINDIFLRIMSADSK